MFADVRELSTERKLVKTVCEQDESESRRVWRDVTVGLRINDMDKATAAKCTIEQKQREEARLRKENNIAWQTKVSGRFLFDFFHLLYNCQLFFFVEQLFKETKDGGWMYIRPLIDRIHSSNDQSNVT